MNYTIKLKGGVKNDIPVLSPREIGICTDTNEVFIGTETGNKDFFKSINDKIGDGFTPENTITSQMNDMTNLGFTKNSKIIWDTISDINEIKHNGFYQIKNSMSNYPSNIITNSLCLLSVIASRSSGNSIIRQFAYSVHEVGKMATRTSVNGESWSNWSQIATVEQIQTMLSAYQLKSV